ncbi:MAG: hypothetical protein JNK21_14605 [Rhodospirillaceae bacterium]|nr:hypothetical protein [Rhodospirillaceae bacterium]
MRDKLLASIVCSVLFLILAFPARSGETRSAVAGVPGPQASLAGLSWLAGEWQGEGLGGQVLDTFSAPAGGQMVGHFRLVKDGKVVFYELFTFAEVNGSLEMRVKHFNPDLTGWEEKAKVQTFPLVAVEKDAWFFDGVTMRRTSNDQMTTTVLISGSNSQTREERFVYRRTR